MGRFSTIRRNEGTCIPSRLVFIDCEAYIKDNPDNPKHQTQTFRLGCGLAGRLRDGKLEGEMKAEFNHAAGIWKWIDSLTEPRTATWIFAHNLTYDATLAGLWDEIRDGRYCFAHWGFGAAGHNGNRQKEPPKAPQLVLGDPPTIIGLLNRQKHKLVAVDSMNYLRTSLRDIGDSIDMPKLDLPPQDAEDHIWLKYCWRDVEILARAITKLLQWWQDSNYGNWGFTAPSLAMHAFRHRFMKHDLRSHTESDVRLLERSSYYGGRLEVHKLGSINEPCYLLDINSLYPYVMKTDEYPTTLWAWDIKQEFSTQLPNFPLESCVAECLIKTDVPAYPMRTTKGTIYPVGEFVTTLCGPELFDAKQTGRLVAVASWAYYQTHPIFFEYVEHFWAFRKECQVKGDKPREELAKLMLNSISGKFSQRGSYWVFDPNATPLYEFGEFMEYDYQKKETRYCLSLWDQIFVRQPLQELKNSIPIISAFINSSARVFMNEMIAAAFPENVYYVSTDAIITNWHGYANLQDSNLIQPETLGRFKINAQGLNGHIGGVNQYRVGKRTCFAGVVNGVTPNEFGEWEQTEFEGLRQVIARGAAAEIRTRKADKYFHAAYNRRNVARDGSTTPFKWPEVPADMERLSFSDSLNNARQHVRLICQFDNEGFGIT